MTKDSNISAPSLPSRGVIAPSSSPAQHLPAAIPSAIESLASGAIGSAALVDAYTHSTSIDALEVLAQLQRDAQAIHAGDTRTMETMLMNQAVALQSMFVEFALLSAKATTTAATQCYAQLAFRAQSGCRATLQTLSEMKNPRQVAFVRQANVAQTQQVNNQIHPRSRAKETKSEPNELLVEEPYGS